MFADYGNTVNFGFRARVVWCSRPFTKHCAEERVWNHAIHLVVTLEFQYYIVVMITFYYHPAAKSISAASVFLRVKIEAY